MAQTSFVPESIYVSSAGVVGQTAAGTCSVLSVATILGYTPADDADVVHTTGDSTVNGFVTFSTSKGIKLTNSLGMASYLISGGEDHIEFGHKVVVDGGPHIVAADVNTYRLDANELGTQGNWEFGDLTLTGDAGIAGSLTVGGTTVSSFGLSLIDDADASAARTTLGLGTMATQASTSYLALSGGTLTGPITGTSGIIEQRSGTTAQVFRLYNTYTDASNYERVFFRCTGSEAEIGWEAAGTGTARNVRVRVPAVTGSVGTSHFSVTDNTSSTLHTKLSTTDNRLVSNVAVSFAAGNSSSAHLTIATTGIATFAGGITPASMADASAANNTIYYSTTASKLVYKDSGGTVNALY